MGRIDRTDSKPTASLRLGCPATVQQVTSLYRTGSFADCKPHIRDAFDCLMMKTKFKDVLQVGERG